MIRALSIYDIMNFEEGRKVVLSGNEGVFRSFLWTLGFDVTKSVERQECLHRPVTAKTNTPVWGMRFVGEERTDADWHESGNRSFESRMEEYRNNDPELYKELSQMSYQHNHTGSLIDHIRSKGSLLPYHGAMNGEDQEYNDN